MSAGNGNGKVLKVDDAGSTRTFEFPGGIRVTCDVIAVECQYWDMRRDLQGEDGKVPPERLTELNERTLAFVQGLLDIDSSSPAPRIDLGTANRFMALVWQETAALRDFFQPATRGRPSSPESTELTFSTSAPN